MAKETIAAGVSVASVRWTQVADILITRPNNVTAYAAMQAFGDAADCRQSFALDTRRALQALRFIHINNRPFGDATIGIGLWFFSAQPATILGDQANFSLSDADIALIAPIGIGANANILLNATVSVGGVATAQLNTGAGAAGRRWQAQHIFTPGFVGATVWFYPVITAAYVPLALEQSRIRILAQYL